MAPISSNLKFYAQAACDFKLKEFYGCYNFKDNGHIRFLFVLFVIYLTCSGFQLSYGFPILKKASSDIQPDPKIQDEQQRPLFPQEFELLLDNGCFTCSLRGYPCQI